MMRYIKPLAPFALGWALLLYTEQFQTMSMVNGVAQIVLFAFVVCLPAWRTGRLSYVDIGWPLGLVLIGLVVMVFGNGLEARKLAIAAAYVFIGSRMGIGALRMWKRGFFKTEFPRYQYQFLRWERDGVGNTRLMIQVEAMVQGLANASFLALPAFVIATNPNPSMAPLELAGLLIWLLAFAMETVADAQKHDFLRKMKAQGLKNPVCNRGLWRYTRHPNYFAEWMVWNALILASVPSWLYLYSEQHIIVWSLIGLSLLYISRCMYVTLVYDTGAEPAEYYSVQKRPEYKIYQQSTNRFFPGPARAK